MEKSELFEQKQIEVSEKFWKEAQIRAAGLGIPPEEMQLVALNVCGMPSWVGMQKLLKEGAFGKRIEVENLPPEDVHYLRKLGEQILSSPECGKLKRWMKERSKELFVLDLQEYDWQFADSVLELRFLIDWANQELQKHPKVSWPLVNTILSSVRELNQLYKLTGTSFDISKTRAVIFVGENQLEN